MRACTHARHAWKLAGSSRGHVAGSNDPLRAFWSAAEELLAGTTTGRLLILNPLALSELFGNLSHAEV
eukprot:6832983-Pyramimonas_sp.AAC.1